MERAENKFEDLSNYIIGADIEIHKILGPGFLESIYHNAMKKELGLRNIPFETEKEIKIIYKDEQMGEHRIDLVVNNEIIVELKAVKKIADIHLAQVISYLKASELHIGLILNFSKSKVEIKRVVLD